MQYNERYKHNLLVFLSVFCALNLVFAYYQMSFFIGNHDWDWVKGTTQVLSLNTGMFEGRYAKFILNVLLFSGQVLPLLNTEIAFALLALGGVLLVQYWQIKSISSQIIVALMPTLAPFILGWLYFPINILGNFSAVPLVIGGLMLAERQQLKYKIISILCFLIALGVYPSVMEMMIVCWCIYQILIKPTELKTSLSTVLLIILSLVLFKLLLVFLGYKGLIYSEHYNMQTVSLMELGKRLPQTFLLAVKQLFDTLPFFPIQYKLIGIVLILYAITATPNKKVNLLVWGTALGATVLSAFLTAAPKEVAYAPRINFYSVNFLYAGATAILLNAKPQKTRNLGLLLSVLYLFISINQDFYAQKVWFLGKTAEEKLVERLTNRIEQKAQNLPLTGVLAGELPLRPKYYFEPYQHQSPYVLNTAFIVRHIPSGMFNFYTPTPLFWGQSQISELTPELYAFLKNANQPYPSPEGIYIDNDYAIILLSTEGINAIQAQLP